MASEYNERGHLSLRYFMPRVLRHCERVARSNRNNETEVFWSVAYGY